MQSTQYSLAQWALSPQRGHTPAPGLSGPEHLFGPKSTAERIPAPLSPFIGEESPGWGRVPGAGGVQTGGRAGGL